VLEPSLWKRRISKLDNVYHNKTQFSSTPSSISTYVYAVYYIYSRLQSSTSYDCKYRLKVRAHLKEFRIKASKEASMCTRWLNFMQSPEQTGLEISCLQHVFKSNLKASTGKGCSKTAPKCAFRLLDQTLPLIYHMCWGLLVSNDATSKSVVVHIWEVSRKGFNLSRASRISNLHPCSYSRQLTMTVKYPPHDCFSIPAGIPF
jgi:hypothetical protein